MRWVHPLFIFRSVYLHRIDRRCGRGINVSAISRAKLFSMVVILMTGVLWAAIPPPPAGDPRLNINGPYDILAVSGDAAGEGQATVSNGGPVSLHADLVDGVTGRSMRLQANGVMTMGRFVGSGTFDGVGVSLDGRADPMDRAGDVVIDGRFVATFVAADGRAGRVMGSRRGIHRKG